MIKKHLLIDIVLVIFFIILLAFPSACIDGAKNGLMLWFNIVIPTLFPFILLSYIILHSGLIDKINRLISPIFSKLFSLPGYAFYALFLGSISGYPMGAKTTVDLYAKKKISLQEANYILSFSNNASPMFIIGFIATKLLKDEGSALYLLLAIYLGNFLTAIISKRLYYNRKKQPLRQKKNRRLPPIVDSSNSKLDFAYIDDCITSTASILVKVGGYIILFSIPSYLLLSQSNNTLITSYLISLLELSNGAYIITSLLCHQIMKYALICSLCAFGSFSVLFQTISIIKKSNLSIRKYFVSKVINTLVTFVTTYVLLYLIGL